MVPPKKNTRGSRRPTQKPVRRAAKQSRPFARLGAMALGAVINTPWGQRMGGHVGITQKGNGIVVTGTDFVAAVPYTTSAAVGDNLYSLAFGVNAISASRLAQFAKLYEFYKVEALAFHFESVMPTTFGGAYIHYYDYDPMDSGVSAAAGLQNAMGHRANKAGKWYESSTLVVPPNPAPRQALECNAPDSGVDDLRDYLHGKYYLLTTSALAAPSSASTLGNVFVTYRIHLYNPAYHTSAGSGAASAASAGYLAFKQYTPGLPASVPFNRLMYDGSACTAEWKWEDKLQSFAQTATSLAGTAVAWSGALVNIQRLIRERAVANTNIYNEGVLLQPGTYRWVARFFTVDNNGDNVGFGYANGSSNDNVFFKLKLCYPDFTDPAAASDLVGWSTRIGRSYLFRRVSGSSYPLYGANGTIEFNIKRAAFVYPILSNDNDTSLDYAFASGMGGGASKWCVEHNILSISDVDAGQKVYPAEDMCDDCIIPPYDPELCGAVRRAMAEEEARRDDDDVEDVVSCFSEKTKMQTRAAIEPARKH